jgi:tRNA G10  N-methylase Trm11
MMGGEKELDLLGENRVEPPAYIYRYSCDEGEQSLCALEKRSLFGSDCGENVIMSNVEMSPSRSPFIKERVEVLCTSNTFDDFKNKVKRLPAVKESFKVKIINHGGTPLSDKIGFTERQAIERELGTLLTGTPDLHQPEIVFAMMRVNGRYYFGPYTESESVWFLHQKKPYQYSTALSTRVARAVVNIAVPNPAGLKVIDPCCGIGTVLVEALSMGVNIIGSDNNPLVMKGARGNIAHFGLSGNVLLRDIRDVNESYDVAIIDMPYNLCSVLSAEDQLEMLQSARRFTKKLVVVTIEPVDEVIKEAGFVIIDRCEVKKGNFSRQILVCQ